MDIIALSHVVIERDWLDDLAIWTGVVSSILGVTALIIALLARRDIVADRRQVFELGVLKEVAEAWARSQDTAGDAGFERRAAMVPDLKLLREWAGAPQNAQQPAVVPPMNIDQAGYNEWVAGLPARTMAWSDYREDMIPKITKEIEDAILARVRG